jgi:predicted transcriptional regulator
MTSDLERAREDLKMVTDQLNHIADTVLDIQARLDKPKTIPESATINLLKYRLTKAERERDEIKKRLNAEISENNQLRKYNLRLNEHMDGIRNILTKSLINDVP